MLIEFNRPPNFQKVPQLPCIPPLIKEHMQPPPCHTLTHTHPSPPRRLALGGSSECTLCLLHSVTVTSPVTRQPQARSGRKTRTVVWSWKADEGRGAGGGGSEGGPASLAAARARARWSTDTRARAREHTPPRSLPSPVRFPNQL